VSDATALPTPTASAEAVDARRARFRAALAGLARSSSSDLIRWVMVPASVAVIVGFNFMLLGWWGASRTHREIEQIPYLISGGLVGLALVFLGGLMLASIFWVVVMRKLQEESDERTRAHLAALESRLDERT
jgi:TRAP-type C4-dicarboxylate transport system permease small subunit